MGMTTHTDTTYDERIARLEAEGMTTSDAQAVADAEDMIRVKVAIYESEAE